MEAGHQPLPARIGAVRHHISALRSRICLGPQPTCLNLAAIRKWTPSPGQPSLLRHPIAAPIGAGMLTCFPSTTPFGLALGADSPCADERCAGTLGLPARRIFTSFIVTHVSIRTSDTSNGPHGPPSQAYRTLLYHAAPSKRRDIRSFGGQFEPRYIFRAGRLDQ